MDLLDPLDAAMMAGEVLSSPLHVAAALVLSPPDDAGPGYIDDLHQQMLTSDVPVDRRLRRYPHRGVDTGGLWTWREVDAVDIGRHCTRRTLPAGSDRNALWRLVSELHSERLPPGRPMWTSCLIDGLHDGRYVLYIKVHHTVMDGVAGLQLITDALSPDPGNRSMPPFYAAHNGDAPGHASHPHGRFPNPFSLLRSVAGGVASSVELTRRAVGGELSDLLHSVTTDTTVPPLVAPYTRFNGRVGHGRAVAAVSLSKTHIRAVQDAAGVTGNDVVTAVIGGVLRKWLQNHDELPDRSLVGLCPISVRSHDHQGADGGNMFGAWLCPLGTHLDDPAARLELIHRSMSEGKHQVADRGAGPSMLLLAQSIAPTLLLPLVPLAPKIRTGYNLPVSNVPGPHTEMYWNGAHLEEIIPVSTVYSGQALNVTTCSYADRVSFGYVAGDNVMPDFDSVVMLTERALADIEAAVGLSANPKE